ESARRRSPWRAPFTLAGARERPPTFAPADDHNSLVALVTTSWPSIGDPWYDLSLHAPICRLLAPPAGRASQRRADPRRLWRRDSARVLAKGAASQGAGDRRPSGARGRDARAHGGQRPLRTGHGARRRAILYHGRAALYCSPGHPLGG